MGLNFITRILVQKFHFKVCNFMQFCELCVSTIYIILLFVWRSPAKSIKPSFHYSRLCQDYAMIVPQLCHEGRKHLQVSSLPRWLIFSVLKHKDLFTADPPWSSGASWRQAFNFFHAKICTNTTPFGSPLLWYQSLWFPYTSEQGCHLHFVCLNWCAISVKSLICQSHCISINLRVFKSVRRDLIDIKSNWEFGRKLNVDCISITSLVTITIIYLLWPTLTRYL